MSFTDLFAFSGEVSFFKNCYYYYYIRLTCEEPKIEEPLLSLVGGHDPNINL